MNRDSLIRTKFQRPEIDPDILPRTELIERLENGRFRKLTLISAPAGYGKSILASILANECSCPAAWLSLDNNDNKLGVFVNYLLSAVQSIFPESFTETEELLIGQQLPSLEIISAYFVNEAAAITDPFIIVLDDYQAISNQEINQLVGTLIHYLPAHIHLVLATRQDPPLDIVSLRVKNEMNEIRLAELRFSEVEVEQYLKSKLGEDISQELALEIFERTEGWAAGLRLAVLALGDHVDRKRFIEGFRGTNLHIMSYLLSEVLSKQPKSFQSFLLQTSLFDRFSAPLCDAVLLVEDSENRVGSQEFLNHLTDSNLFIISLDHHGKWFRYHHLFQDLLRHQFDARFSEKAINQLHRRASSWFAGQGLLDEALDHAFSAGDTDLAAEIVARARLELMQQTQWQRLEQLLHRFPQDFVKSHPDLLMAETWLHYQKSQLRKLPSAFERLEELISQRANGAEDYRYLVGEMSALRSLLLYHAMDSDGVIINAEQALNLTVPKLGIVRVLARLMLAGTQQSAGDLNSAYATIYRAFDEEPYQSNTLKAAVLVTACFVSWVSADLKTLQQTAAQAIKLAQDPRSPGMLGLGHYFSGMLAYHQNELAAAEMHFSFVNQRPYTTYDDSFVYSACGLALTYQALGKGQEAIDVVESALSYLLVTGNSEMLPVVQAFQAELALRQGQLSVASQRATWLDPAPPLSPMNQFYVPHMTLAKVWLAENTPASREKAAGLLARLREFLESIHNKIFLIETMALQAILYQLQGDEGAASAALEEALVLALPGGSIRPFVDLGAIMGNLLVNLPVKEPELAAFKERIVAATSPLTGHLRSALQDDNGSQPLIEPLTDRELDVLLLLNQRQTDKEIANKLHISSHTVRSHTKNIYAKLSVNNRRQAATRAEELGLI